MAGTSRKRQESERAEEINTTEKKAGRSRKSPAARKADETLNEKKSRGKKASSGQAADGGTGAKKRSKQTLPAVDETETSGFMGTEVAIIVTFAVSVLLFLSNFGLCGFVGSLLRSMLLGIFGVMGYLVPFLLFMGTCFYLSNRGNQKAKAKLLAVGAVILALCGLSQLLFAGGQHLDWSLGDYYSQSGGGGLIGGLLTMLLCGTVGTIGAFLILLVLLALGAVCITERSLVNFVKQGSGKAYEYAKEDMSRRREMHEERKEEKRRLREEQRVRGVDLEGTKLVDVPVMRDFSEGVPEGTILGPEDAPEKFRESHRNPEPQEKDPADVFRGGIVHGGRTVADEPASKQESESGEPYAYGASEEAFQKEVERELARTVHEQEAEAAALETERQTAAGMYREERTRDRAEEAAEQDEQPTVHDDISEKGSSLEPHENGGVSDQLLKRLYVRRDTRTMEEFAGGESRKGPGYYPVGTPERTGSKIDLSESPDEWETISMDDEPVEEEPERPELLQAETAEPVENMDMQEKMEPIDASTSFSQVKLSATPAQSDFLEQEEPEASVKPIDGYYKTLESEHGEADGSFFVPEDSKTVVTASGKVIETDTEAIQKTLERKREERKALPVDELTVPEQIERKEEEEKKVQKEYIFPPLTLLKRGTGQTDFSDQEYRETAIKLQQTLRNFGVGVTVTNISCGPTVTRYELHPEQGVKVSKIVALADDIKLNLAAADIRIEAPIPGKAAVGIEVPNKENHVVLLRDLLESEAFKKYPSRLAFAVGKDIAGQTVVSDIAKMPHLLIAGATGSGKSVCINTLIMSVIYKAKPSEVRLIMIDPKVVELSVYNGIPHLLIPVVTDPKKASGALNWAVAEMTDRYQKFAKYGVRDLKGFNAKVESIADIDDPKKPEKLPQIIIIVDELADLMMVAPGEVEDSICRLAQLARAAGIHLVIATQRPSVNVITGVIKANIPSRIAFSVSSGVDSRTIIDMNGAEKLLGKGDMLFYPSGYQKPQRVQGAFVSDTEVSDVVEFLKKEGLTAEYSAEVESKIRSTAMDAGFGGGERDAYFAQAGKFIIEKDKASIGMLQRMFKIGFNRAARIMDQLADAGVVGEEEGTKPRKVLMSMEQFENMMEEGY